MKMDKICFKYIYKEKSYLDLELTKNKIYKLKDLGIYDGCIIPLIENDNGGILEILPSHLKKFEINRCQND